MDVVIITKEGRKKKRKKKKDEGVTKSKHTYIQGRNGRETRRVLVGAVGKLVDEERVLIACLAGRQ